MKDAGEPLDPALLEVLDALGITQDAAPAPSDWGPCLKAVSALLRDREEEVEGRSRRVVGALSDDARSAERVFEAFLSTMSHELRTPVAVILGCLELLGSGGVAAEGDRRSTVATARRSALDLIQTIDNILDYCRIEAGELGLVRRPFELEPLVTEVLSRHRPQADARGLALEYRADTRLPRRLAGDAHRIEQVLDVLLDNALKFTRLGFVRVAVQLEEPDAAEPLLRFSVMDSGPGIPRGALDQIFAPFQQLDGSPSRRHGGIGLGLSLAQKLIGAMGGRLEVSSAPDRGSTFTFSVRFATVQEQPQPTRRRRACRRRIPRLLLAEDNEFNRSFIARSLEVIGCAVRAVPDGRAALAALRGFEPDLVLLDVQMPEVDGLTAARHIRGLEEPFASVPIIALTANSQHAHRAQCEDAGMDELLAKPVSVESLRATLERWIELPAATSDDEPAPATVPASGGTAEGKSDVRRRRRAARQPEPPALAPSPDSSPEDTIEVADLLSSAAGILDLGRIEELVHQAGSVGILRELSAIFLEDMGVRLAGLSEAYTAGDEEEVRRLAHAVKGSSANFGALEMAQWAERLELDAVSDSQRSDLSALERAFIDVRRVLQHVVLTDSTDSAGAAGGAK